MSLYCLLNKRSAYVYINELFSSVFFGRVAELDALTQPIFIKSIEFPIFRPNHNWLSPWFLPLALKSLGWSPRLLWLVLLPFSLRVSLETPLLMIESQFPELRLYLRQQSSILDSCLSFSFSPAPSPTSIDLRLINI